MPQALHLIEGSAGTTEEVLPGITAIKTGGHFPGSLVLHWEKKLFIADTIVTVPVRSISTFTHSRRLYNTHLLTNKKVRLYAPPASSRPNQLLVPMVNPKHDPAGTLRDREDLAGN